MAMTKTLGRHYIVELVGCDPERIKWIDDVRDVVLAAVTGCGATPVAHSFHQFEPFGASGTVLIAESHFSLHSWPEENYMSLDIFTCGERMDPDAAIEIVREGFGADEVRVKRLERGY